MQTDLVALFLLVFPLMFSPGPTNLLSAASGARYGLRKTVALVIGMDLMVLVPALVFGWGFLTFAALAHWLIAVLRWLGVAVIAFLAWQFWTAEPHRAEAAEGAGPPGLLSGVLVQLGNVKGMALLVVVYSQVLRPEAPLARQVIEISLALTVYSLVSHFSWAFGGDRLARHFNTPGAIRLQNRIYAVLLAATCLWLLLS